MITSPEIWRPVVGSPDYEVSDHGRVRSIDRVKTYQRFDPPTGQTLTISRRHRGRVLRPGTAESGHQIVVLGRGETRLVHHLVLEAFVGPCPAGMECCHFNDVPADNSLGNLRWDTRAANMADFKRNYGHPQSKRSLAAHV